MEAPNTSSQQGRIHPCCICTKSDGVETGWKANVNARKRCFPDPQGLAYSLSQAISAVYFVFYYVPLIAWLALFSAVLWSWTDSPAVVLDAGRQRIWQRGGSQQSMACVLPFAAFPPL